MISHKTSSFLYQFHGEVERGPSRDYPRVPLLSIGQVRGDRESAGLSLAHTRDALLVALDDLCMKWEICVLKSSVIQQSFFVFSLGSAYDPLSINALFVTRV